MSVKSLHIINLIIILLNIIYLSTSTITWKDNENLFEMSSHGTLQAYKLPQNEIKIVESEVKMEEEDTIIKVYELKYIPTNDITLVYKKMTVKSIAETGDGILFLKAGIPQILFRYYSREPISERNPLKFMTLVEKNNQEIVSKAVLRFPNYSQPIISPMEFNDHVMSNQKILEIIRVYEKTYIHNNGEKFPNSDFFAFRNEFICINLDETMTNLRNSMNNYLVNVTKSFMLNQVDQFQIEDPRKLHGMSPMNIIKTNPDKVVKEKISKIIKIEADNLTGMKNSFHDFNKFNDLIKEILSLETLENSFIELVNNNEKNWLLSIIENDQYAPNLKYSIEPYWNKKKNTSNDLINIQERLLNYFLGLLQSKLLNIFTEKVKTNTDFQNSLKSLTNNIEGAINSALDSIKEAIATEWPNKVDFIEERKNIFINQVKLLPFITWEFLSFNTEKIRKFIYSYANTSEHRLFLELMGLENYTFKASKLFKTLSHFSTNVDFHQDSETINLFELKKMILV